MLKSSLSNASTPPSGGYPCVALCAPDTAQNDNLSGSLETSVIHLVAQQLAVTPGLLTVPRRCRAPVAHARQLAMYLLHVAAGWNMEAVANVFGRSRATVSFACGRVEDRRDDPQFEMLVSRLEIVVGLLADKSGASVDEGARDEHH